MIRLSEILNEVLTEDKLYGKKIIDATTNRIGDKSEDTLNKLAIAGLFRDQFGDIQKLRSREQLDDVFNKWYKSTISQLIKTDSFPENRNNAKRYLDAYINNIRTLGVDAKRFSIKKVESSLVDVVNNYRWLGDDVSVNKGSIYEPDSKDVVYEDDELIILDSKTKARCVKYGAGESWCIGKPTLNYYNTYRLRDGATPYHVLQKNVEGNEHKMVIMNYGNRGYAIADRSNSGDRSGGPTLAKSWDKIEQEIPNLNGKEQYFKYRPVTQEEKKYSNLLSSAYKGSGFQSFIDKNTAGLVVNESEVTPEDFIRDYVVNGHTISDKQLSELRESLIESIVEAGYFLTKGVKQTDVLNDRQKRRVIRLKLENKVALTDNEVEMIKGDSVLLEKYQETVRGKLKEYLDSSSSYGRGVNKLTYGELMVLTPHEISAYVNIMDKELVSRFLRDEGIDKIDFLKEYGGENDIVSNIARAKEMVKDKNEETLNELLPSGIEVEFKYNDIIFNNIEQDRLDNTTTDLLNRLADDTWDSGYYDDYYDGDEERLDEEYETYIGQAMGNADFADAMAFYEFGTDAKTIGENFDTYELKDGIIEVIKEVMADASHDAKVTEWDNIHSAASEIISLDCNYRYRGSECELTMDLNSFIISNGYMLFELDDPMEDFYDALDSVLNNYLDLYDDKIPTNVDDIWERVNDYNMTPDADKIISHIIDAGDEMIEKANEDDEDDDNLDDNSKLMPIDMVIEKFKETLRGLKQSEHADKIENKLVRIQFDKRRLKRDGSVFVNMLDKSTNKTMEGFMKIDDIPTYFTNYKLAMGESVRRLLRRQLI